MKKLLAILLTIVTLLSLTACGNTLPGSSAANKDTPEETFVTIKESPDKYTWYIKNYVGKNCAAFGSEYGGYLCDKYGDARVKFIFIAEDNSFVNPEDKESLKNYVVTAQSVEPNTELKLVFATWADGSEASGVVDRQNIEEIELYVKRIDNSSSTNE